MRRRTAESGRRQRPRRRSRTLEVLLATDTSRARVEPDDLDGKTTGELGRNHGGSAADVEDAHAGRDEWFGRPVTQETASTFAASRWASRALHRVAIRAAVICDIFHRSCRLHARPSIDSLDSAVEARQVRVRRLEAGLEPDALRVPADELRAGGYRVRRVPVGDDERDLPQREVAVGFCRRAQQRPDRGPASWGVSPGWSSRSQRFSRKLKLKPKRPPPRDRRAEKLVAFPGKPEMPVAAKPDKPVEVVDRGQLEVVVVEPFGRGKDRAARRRRQAQEVGPC